MKCCVLITGLPASGKTTFADYLSRQTNLPMVSKDRLKELMYDTVGFRSHSDKIRLSVAASRLLYYFAEQLMVAGTTFILEHNFENVMKPELTRLLKHYRYHTVTVRFGGDIEVLYQRYIQRNQQEERHGGHKNNHAWIPEPLENTGLLAGVMSIDEFMMGVRQRGIADFSAGGEELCVDTTDFSSVSFENLTEQVCRMVRVYETDPR